MENNNKLSEIEMLKTNLRVSEDNAAAKSHEVTLMNTQADERTQIIQTLEEKVKK